MALIALGLSLIFGLMEIVNIAHGGFYMWRAMLTWFAIALDLCNRVYIMDRGQIVFHGTPEQLKNMHEVLLRYLGVY